MPDLVVDKYLRVVSFLERVSVEGIGANSS